MKVLTKFCKEVDKFNVNHVKGGTKAQNQSKVWSRDLGQSPSPNEDGHIYDTYALKVRSLRRIEVAYGLSKRLSSHPPCPTQGEEGFFYIEVIN